nr:hypothetical protein GTC16762_07870 [Pigmentibacter ruber]
MNIIITLAGHSRRFNLAGYQVPKAFIDIDGIPMVSHVVDMFHPNDNFYFIVNSEQLSQYPESIKKLENLVVNSKIIVIEPHEIGPVYSVLFVKNHLKCDEPILITYCDFIVDWDYDKFLKEVSNYHGAIPAFKGFHPASFGNTYYAYMRTENNELLELREKKSFTDDRTQEFASVGIYYFDKWELFEKYAVNYLEGSYEKSLPEAYLSLLFNPIVQDGLSVKITQVDKFICWGTPEDLAQYLFWLKYFKYFADEFRQKSINQTILENKISENPRTINLIPMAGKGSRFKNDGYRVTKPLIQVLGKPMAISASLSFPEAERWIFLLRDTELAKHPIKKALLDFKPHASIVGIDHDTAGQASTCLLVKDQLHPDAHLFIASCDYQTIYNKKIWQEILEDEEIDGAIWTFRMGTGIFKNPNAFAYCRVATDNKTIIEVIEKKTISDNPENDPAVVGSFWFRKSSDFILGAETMIKNDIRVNNEYYVGTSINTLLQLGRKFVIFDVDQWISFGDPFELQVFEYWESHFYKRFK